MVHLYKELQPADHFEVKLPHFLSTNERQLITLFYQPLTGPEPISLYLTLWAEGEFAQANPMTHYHLMNVLDMPLPKVFEARIALEAIGLLRTWRKDGENSRQFIYELVRPLDAQTFFQDPLLSMFLFSKIGEQAYLKLRKRFIRHINKDHFQEMSRSFTDVFKPVHSNIPTDNFETKSTGKHEYPFYMEEFDFRLLKSGLNEQLVPSSALTIEARETIAKLAYLYKLTPIHMQKIVILALDEKNELSRERLKKAAADFYKLTVSTEPPKLEKTFDARRENSQKIEDSNKTKEQEILDYFETTNPIDHLRKLNNGKEPTEYTKDLVSNLFVNHGMSIGVVNVLIEYVMLQTDRKLPKNFVETIADHWNRKNITTAKDAMELARSEHDKYKQMKNKQYVPKVKKAPQIQSVPSELARYENTIPYEFLKQLNNGKEPFAFTVELAESLVEKYSMPIGVVNVLMEYVMRETDMKLPEKYVHRVADHWNRKNVATAKEAMDIIAQEHDKMSKWKEESGKKYVPRKQNVYVEKKPEWFNESAESKVKSDESIDVEKEHEELMKKLGIYEGQ